ncbi:MAG TPA: hypothetical protein VF210_01555 [Pseudomonadales bacterium]
MDQIVGKTAASMGSDHYGRMDLPEADQPARGSEALLWKYWNPTRNVLVLNRQNPEIWPFVFALAAQQLLMAGKDVMDPTLAARILLEAAVPMSRLDPGRIHGAHLAAVLLIGANHRAHTPPRLSGAGDPPSTSRTPSSLAICAATQVRPLSRSVTSACRVPAPERLLPVGIGPGEAAVLHHVFVAAPDVVHEQIERPVCSDLVEQRRHRRVVAMIDAARGCLGRYLLQRGQQAAMGSTPCGTSPPPCRGEPRQQDQQHAAE